MISKTLPMPEWLGDYLTDISKFYDISLGDTMRSYIGIGIIVSCGLALGKKKSDKEVCDMMLQNPIIAKLRKNIGVPDITEDRLLMNDILYEARKMSERRMI